MDDTATDQRDASMNAAGSMSEAVDDRRASSGRRARSTAPWWARLLFWAAGIAVLSFAIGSTTSIGSTTVVPALILGAVIFRVGYLFLQQLATPPPPPPDAGTLRKVRLTYRCSVCGTEVRMTAANNEDPEPPRHCMEDMDLVAPLYD